MNKGISTGTGLAYIQKITNIDSLHSASVGDGENDLSMFAVSGTKIAMGNAMEAVKDNADYIADVNANDGVGKWIKKCFLLYFIRVKPFTISFPSYYPNNNKLIIAAICFVRIIFYS